MDSLKNKLTRFEAPPPHQVWERIAEQLDEGRNFSERLYHYAAPPSPTTWSEIEKNLNEEGTPAKVVPFTIRYKKGLRYVAAASVFAFILVSATLLLKRTEAGAIQTGSKTTVPVKPSSVQVPNENRVLQNNTVAILNPVQNQTIAVSERRHFRSHLLPQKILASVAITGRFFPDKAVQASIVNNASLDNYMVISDGKGMNMRLPKKLFPLVYCREGDASCLQRIRALQQVLSTAALTADFTALVEMLRRVE